MRLDYIKVKPLYGELVLSQVRRGLRCSITTRELYFQKPHISYHILLEDILSIVPHDLSSRSHTFSSPYHTQVITTVNFPGKYYKLHINEMKVFTRSGTHTRSHADLIVQLTDNFLDYIAKYAPLTVIK